MTEVEVLVKNEVNSGRPNETVIRTSLFSCRYRNHRRQEKVSFTQIFGRKVNLLHPGPTRICFRFQEQNPA